MSAVLIACTACTLVVRVMGDDAEVDALVGPGSERWPDQFSCPHCGERARGLFEHESEPSALTMAGVVDVSPAEAFAAMEGFGLPDEQACSRARVEELLFMEPVRRVAGKEIAGRLCVEHLELGSGTRLYFGASVEGAVVYRVTQPPSYAARVIQEVETKGAATPCSST